jgi:hypothetical protein
VLVGVEAIVTSRRTPSQHHTRPEELELNLIFSLPLHVFFFFLSSEKKTKKEGPKDDSSKTKSPNTAAVPQLARCPTKW